MKKGTTALRPRWLVFASLIMAFLLAVSSITSPQMISVSYAKYVSLEDAGTLHLSVKHAHALLTTGFKLNRALATGTTTSGAAGKYTEITANTSLTEVYFGTPTEFASQIAGITGVDVSYYGDGSIKLYKNGTKAYIVSDRAIAASEDFSCAFTQFTKLSKVHFSENFDTSRVKTFAYFFYNCASLASVENLSSFDTSNTTSMQSMFYVSTSAATPNTTLKSLDLSSFNTSKVEDMGSIFRSCAGLTSIDVTGFDTSNVWDMGGMFAGCSGLTSVDVTGFDTSNAETMQVMFSGCKGLKTLDLRSFSCESLENMAGMFENCSNLTTIYADYDFDCRSLSDPPATDETDKNGNYEIDTAFAGIFKGCTKLVGGSGTKYDEDIIHNLRAVVDVRLAVEQTVFQSTVGYFTHYSGANPGSTFLKNGQDFNAAVKTLANGSSKDYTFQDTAVKKIYFGKTGSYNVSGLKSVNVDSAGAGTIKAYWNPSNDTIYVLSDSTICFSSSSDYMFDNFRGVTGIHFDNISTSAMRTMQRMFSYCLNLTDLNLSKFETHNVVDYGSCFRDAAFSTATAQNNIIPYLNTSKARDIGGLFMYCSNLTGALDLSSLSTGKAETIASLVQQCPNITSVDISGFTNGAITNCSSMFSGCTNLERIYTNANFNLNRAAITNGGDMFTGCTKLVGGSGTKFSASNITNTYARADAAGTPGYFTAFSTMSMMYMAFRPAPAEEVVSESDIAEIPVVSESDATTAASPTDMETSASETTTTTTRTVTVVTTVKTTAATTAPTEVSSSDITSPTAASTAASEASTTTASQSTSAAATSVTQAVTSASTSLSSAAVTSQTTVPTSAASTTAASQATTTTTVTTTTTTTTAAPTTTTATAAAAN